MKHSNSFIIVEMNTRDDKIVLIQSTWEIIVHYLYYIFSFLFFYVKYYSVETCYISNGKKNTVVNNINVILFDNGLYLEKIKILIPYENLVYFYKKQNNYKIICLAKYENGSIILGDSLLTFKFHKIFNNTNFQKVIIKNMNYHLKYNKINFGILNYSVVKYLKVNK